MDYMPELREMCETLGRTIKDANEKIRVAGGKLTVGDADFVNKLTHALKSVKATMAMIEAEEMGEDDYSERGYSRDGGSYRGRYSMDGGSYRGYDDGGSYARGRGRNARRDSMGRYSNRGYSRDGYSGHDEMVEELRELMQDAPDEQTRKELQGMIQRLEQR